MWLSSSRGFGRVLRDGHDHPRHAEAVRHLAEARREKRLGERHLHLAALLQGLEQAVCLRDVGCHDRQSESFKVGASLAIAVRGHNSCIADAEAGMQYLVVGACGTMAESGASL